jgi:hypothetical protein
MRTYSPNTCYHDEDKRKPIETMARPKIENKKPRVNMTLNSFIVEKAREIAEREGMSLSELVETLLDAHNKAVRGERGKTQSAKRIERAAATVAGK